MDDYLYFLNPILKLPATLSKTAKMPGKVVL